MKLTTVVLTAAVLFLSHAGFAFPSTRPEDVRHWSSEQYILSHKQIRSNLAYGRSLNHAHPGAVVAAPGVVVDHSNGEHQNYQFHWVRDGALVMRSLIKVYETSDDYEMKAEIATDVANYIALTEKHQARAADLGEPKFHLNGEPFTGPWGRPQNDGPALRAMTLMSWLKVLDTQRQQEKATRIFENVIVRDLDYVAKVHSQPSFEVWEEVLGSHFYITMTHATALEKGSQLALRYGDLDRALTYQNAATAAKNRLNTFLSERSGYIEATKSQTAGTVWDKKSNLDVAVILSSLWAQDFSIPVAKLFSPANPWLLATAEHLQKAFAETYQINKAGYPGILIGRYPEDHYFGGNPWPIATLGFAELYYRLIVEIDKINEFRVLPLNVEFLNRAMSNAGREEFKVGNLIERGSERHRELLQTLFSSADQILTRVRFHMGANGEIFEQFDRHTGALTALPHLTWSHAAMLEALVARKLAEAQLVRESKSFCEAEMQTMAM